MHTFPNAPPIIRVFDRASVRELDRTAIEHYSIPGVVLMENAACAIEGAVRLLHDDTPVLRATILCGPGNNGGDGFALARRLHNRGLPVRVILAADEDAIRGDALTNWRIARAMGLEIVHVASDGAGGSGALPCPHEGDLFVDALFGTGLNRPLRDPGPALVGALSRAREAGARVLSVDIPSGLDCDSGLPVEGSPCVVADTTLTLAGLKKGMLHPHARRWTGRVLVGDIGVPVELLHRLGQPLPEGSANNLSPASETPGDD